jgi:FKBP-type peptidyl-prolyl cis-trans isomerase FkpA
MHPRYRLAAAFGAAASTLAACARERAGDAADSAAGAAAPSTPANPDPAQNTYAPDLAVDLAKFTKTESGVLYQDVTPGTGAEAKYNTRVRVHYTGWLPNGKEFDSSRKGGTPFEFTIGAKEVIRGWDEGVPGMKVGGRRKLVLPAALGYGADGAPPDIPPNSVLVFDVELLDVKPPG